MREHWDAAPLGGLLVTLIDHRGKTPKKLGYPDFSTEGVPVVSAIHIKGGRIVWQERERFVPYPLFERWMPERLKKGDVLVTSEAPLGEVAEVSSDDPLVLSQRLFALRGKAHLLDNRYLRYFLQSEPGQRALHDRATGSTVQGIRQSELVKVVVPLPPLAEQREIAGVLGALDDLIDTNESAITSTLDLVGCSFERRFGDRNLGLAVAEIADVVDCLHSKKPSRIDTGSQVLLQLENIRDNGLLDVSNRYLISSEDYHRWTSKFETRPWDVVVTNVGRVGASARIPVGVAAALGRNMTGIRLREPGCDGSFLACSLLSAGVREEIRQKTDVGTILDALNVRSIPTLRLPASSPAERVAFHSLAAPLLEWSDSLLEENQRLRKTRDELLPVLMSGQVAVREVVADAAV